MDHERIVLCMKWGTLYPAAYVNLLHRACRRAMTGAFRFVCLTDSFEGYDAGVEALPIPDIGLAPDKWYTSGVWPKLAIYGADLHGLSGRCLFIDLDMVVLRGLDAFFELPGAFVSMDHGPNWRRLVDADADHPGHCATSIFRFEIGRETAILDAFLADPERAMAEFLNEQDFVGAHASEVSFWPARWVLSFKRHLRRPAGVGMVLPPRAPPDWARVIAFHGEPRPVDLTRSGWWGEFPNLGRGPVRWMTDYWALADDDRG